MPPGSVRSTTEKYFNTQIMYWLIEIFKKIRINYGKNNTSGTVEID